MNVACSTNCFARYPLDRALRLIGELEFSKLDVAIHEDGPHLKPSEVAADVALAAQRIRIGPSLTPGAFSLEIAPCGAAEYHRQLRAVCRLARVGYDRLLSVALNDVAEAPFAMESEVRKLKYLLESLI